MGWSDAYVKEYIYKEANIWLNDRLRKAGRISQY